MTEDQMLCSTCYIWGHSRPSYGNLCKNCNYYGLCERCAKNDLCFIFRQKMPNYDPAKDPRMGSAEKQSAWCALHGKKRGITNLEDNGDGTYNCKFDCHCKGTGEKHQRQRQIAWQRQKRQTIERARETPHHKDFLWIDSLMKCVLF